MKLFFIFISLIFLLGCSITKRHYNSGWYCSSTDFSRKPKTHYSVKSDDAKKKTHHYYRQDSFMKKAGQAQIQTVQASPDITNPANRKVENSFKKFPLNISYFKKNGDMNSSEISHHDSQDNIKVSKREHIPRGISKRWKTVWLTILITVLVSAFILAGALWPVAYIVWFGLAALLALIGFSSTKTTKSERFYVVLSFVLLALFYYWIYIAFPILLQAILIQLIIYGTIVLIFGIVNLLKKK